MNRRSIPSAILLALVVVSVSGCAAIKGERVETGIADPNAPTTLEPNFVEVEDSAATADLANSGQTTNVVAEDGPVAVADVLQVRPLSDFEPNWTTKPEAFDFFTPELFSGAPTSGADLYASGPVLMTFVSPNCAISIEDGPTYSEVAERNQSITFVFVHTDGDAASFEQFVEDADLYHQNVIHIDDTDLVLWNRFGIESQPSTLLVNRDGQASLTGGGLGHEGLTIAVELLGATM